MYFDEIPITQTAVTICSKLLNIYYSNAFEGDKQTAERVLYDISYILHQPFVRYRLRGVELASRSSKPKVNEKLNFLYKKIGLHDDEARLISSIPEYIESKMIYLRL